MMRVCRLTPVLLLVVSGLFTACQSEPASVSAPPAASAVVVKSGAAPTPEALPTAAVAAEAPVEAAADSAGAETATYYVVVADTGRSYPALRARMRSLSRQFALGIDTLGRYFDPRKNQLVLPEDDEDEMYAGEYYPRRFPSHTLSVEYLNEYKDQAEAKTMAVVTGIYEREASADSAVAVLGRADNKVFKLKSEIFVGCMH